jgi:hypothetical protein
MDHVTSRSVSKLGKQCLSSYKHRTRFRGACLFLDVWVVGRGGGAHSAELKQVRERVLHEHTRNNACTQRDNNR